MTGTTGPVDAGDRRPGGGRRPVRRSSARNAPRAPRRAPRSRGSRVEALLRTIVVRRGEDDYLFVLVPAGRRFDWPKLRAHLGVSRLSLPDADEAQAATGYVRVHDHAVRLDPRLAGHRGRRDRRARASSRSGAATSGSTSTSPRPTSSGRSTRSSSTSRSRSPTTGTDATPVQASNGAPTVDVDPPGCGTIVDRCRPCRSPRSWPARSSGASRGTCVASAASSTAASSCRWPRGSSSSSLIAAVLITLLEKTGRSSRSSTRSTGGSPPSSAPATPAFVTSPGGRIVSWLLILFGVAMLGMITGALVAMVIDFLLKEGQGLGSSGHKDHIIVCGWNSTARDLIDELKGDDYPQKVVVLADLDKNPAGLRRLLRPRRRDQRRGPRAGRASRTPRRRSSSRSTARTRRTCTRSSRSWRSSRSRPRCAPSPRSTTPSTSRTSFAPSVDELLVTSKVASRLLARSALYPGLSAIMTDIVSGGEGSELYRIALPDEYLGQSIDEVARCCAGTTSATLLSVNRGGRAFVNPPGPTSSSRQATTRSSWPRASARSRRSRCATSTTAPRTASVVPSA